MVKQYLSVGITMLATKTFSDNIFAAWQHHAATMRRGVRTVAILVDHIISIRRAAHPRLEHGNWRALYQLPFKREAAAGTQLLQ